VAAGKDIAESLPFPSLGEATALVRRRQNGLSDSSHVSLMKRAGVVGLGEAAWPFSFESVHHPGNGDFEAGFRACVDEFEEIFG
jgi:hypothetical protein